MQEKTSSIGSKPARPYRVGLIHYVGKDDKFVDTRDIRDFKTGMSRMGYREGENVEYLERYSDRDINLTRKNAEEILGWNPDVVVSFLTNANIVLKELTVESQVPVVCWATNLMEAGLIKSHQKPGMNFTGFSYVPDNEWAKVRVLKKAVPGMRKVAHLYNPTYSPAPAAMLDFKEAVEAMGGEMVIYETLRLDEFENSINAMKADGCDSVLVGPHELFHTNGKRLGELFLQAGLPAVGNQLSIALHGGIAALTAPKEHGWPMMAYVVDQILNGAVAGEIPIYRSMKSHMTLNLGAARALGLTLSPALIDEADTVLP